MKKILLGLCLLLLASCSSTKTNESNKIGIVQLVEHTSLNIINDAIMERLKELGYSEADIKYINAQGDVASLPTIMQNLKGDSVEVVVAITTPVAQSAKTISTDIPVVFSAVSNPVGAGILNDISDTTGNITGTSDPVKVEEIMDLALSLHDIKTVGYIYNASESNSVTSLNKLEEYAASHDLKLDIITISSSSELQNATGAICEKADMIFVSNDNTVAEAMPILVNEAAIYNVPVYTGADSMVKDGGLATVGIDYEAVGIKTADMVDRILKGESTADIPVETFDNNLNVYFNKVAVESLDLDISSYPDAIIFGE